jgi:hypothetical protein
MQRVHRGCVGQQLVGHCAIDYCAIAHHVLDSTAVNIVNHNVANHNAIYPGNALSKAQPRNFRHHKNNDEKQQKYERFPSHGCKGTTFWAVTEFLRTEIMGNCGKLTLQAPNKPANSVYGHLKQQTKKDT